VGKTVKLSNLCFLTIPPFYQLYLGNFIDMKSILGNLMKNGGKMRIFVKISSFNKITVFTIF